MIFRTLNEFLETQNGNRHWKKRKACTVLVQRHKRPGQPGEAGAHGQSPSVEHRQWHGGGEWFGRGGGERPAARQLGSMASAPGKEKGNAAHQASGATTTAERGQFCSVLRQRQHCGGRRRALAGHADGRGGGG
jgi:hypothetical protein